MKNHLASPVPPMRAGEQADDLKDLEIMLSATIGLQEKKPQGYFVEKYSRILSPEDIEVLRQKYEDSTPRANSHP